jgi:CubicO group peptidase (beta-lactamase class C family)
MALAIVRDGKPVHVRGFGSIRPSGPPVTARTPFILGSLSKSFTALAVLQLVEAGRLELDSPVTDYLPWFRLASAQNAPITPRHLLQHTSGISPKAHASSGDRSTLEQQVRSLCESEAVGEPGERHRYSSMNYLVLGVVIEQVSGESFERHVERGIFEPLKMTSSFTSHGSARAAGLSAGHRLWFGVPRATDMPPESDRLPTAGLMSSAEDLAAYLSALMGTHPASEAVVSARTREAIELPGAPADGFSYNMGWRNGTTAGVPSLWHGGALPHFRGGAFLT